VFGRIRPLARCVIELRRGLRFGSPQFMFGENQMLDIEMHASELREYQVSEGHWTA